MKPMNIITFVKHLRSYKMKKWYLIVALFLVSQIANVNAQCSFTASFQKPGSACSGVPLIFGNTSTVNGAATYNWDFCAGDLERTPSGAITGTYSNSDIASPYNVEEVFDGTNYYAFVSNGGNGN